MLREIDEICARNSMVKSKFVQRGVQMAIDDARKRFGEAANEPVAAPKPITAAQVFAKSGEIAVTHFRRGVVTWFDMAEVCTILGISVDALLAEIDPKDDVLNYQSKDWIDASGIAEARALSRNTAASDSLWAYAQSRIDSSI